MPELPEVERARRLLVEHCVGLKIIKCVAVEQGGGPRDGKFDEIVIQVKPIHCSNKDFPLNE